MEVRQFRKELNKLKDEFNNMISEHVFCSEDVANEMFCPIYRQLDEIELLQGDGEINERENDFNTKEIDHKKIDWEERRFDLVKQIFPMFKDCENEDYAVETCVMLADKLIEKLQK